MSNSWQHICCSFIHFFISISIDLCTPCMVSKENSSCYFLLIICKLSLFHQMQTFFYYVENNDIFHIKIRTLNIQQHKSNTFACSSYRQLKFNLPKARNKYMSFRQRSWSRSGLLLNKYTRDKPDVIPAAIAYMCSSFKIKKHKKNVQRNRNNFN